MVDLELGLQKSFKANIKGNISSTQAMWLSTDIASRFRFYFGDSRRIEIERI